MNGHATLLRDCRLLIADDDPFSRSIVSRMVKALGCDDLIEAEDGAGAFRALANPTKPIDIAILDFRMPAYNGLKLLQEVRVGERISNRFVRVVMLTSSGDYGLLGAAMALDVDAFLTKPVTQEQMAVRLQRVKNQWSELKPAEKYAAVDVDAVADRLIGASPKPPPRPAQPKQGARTALDAAQPGMVLAEPIEGPNGELVLDSGVKLSERLLRRLVEVREILRLDQLYIED